MIAQEQIHTTDYVSNVAETCFVYDGTGKKVVDTINCELISDEHGDPLLQLTLVRPPEGGPYYALTPIKGTDYAIFTYFPQLQGDAMSGGQVACIEPGNIFAACVIAGSCSEFTNFLIHDLEVANACNAAFEKPITIDLPGSDGQLRSISLMTDTTGKSGLFKISNNPMDTINGQNSGTNPFVIIGEPNSSDNFMPVPLNTLVDLLDHRQNLAGPDRFSRNISSGDIAIPLGIIDSFPTKSSTIDLTPSQAEIITMPLEDLVDPGMASTPTKFKPHDLDIHDRVDRSIKPRPRIEGALTFSETIDFPNLSKSVDIIVMPNDHPLAKNMYKTIQSASLPIENISDASHQIVKQSKWKDHKWIPDFIKKWFKITDKPNPVRIIKDASTPLKLTPNLVKFQLDGSLFIIGHDKNNYYQFTIPKVDATKIVIDARVGEQLDITATDDLRRMIALSQNNRYISVHTNRTSGAIFIPTSILSDITINAPRGTIKEIQHACQSSKLVSSTSPVKIFTQNGEPAYLNLPICFPMQPNAIIQGPNFNTVIAEVSLLDLNLNTTQYTQMLQAFGGTVPASFMIQVNTADIYTSGNAKSSSSPIPTQAQPRMLADHHHRQTQVLARQMRKHI